MASPEPNQQSPKVRNACDRCHTLKSRCTRQPGMESCSRCIRLAMTCVYSPPLRLGRPKGSKRGASANRRGSEAEDRNEGMRTAHTATDQSGTLPASTSAAYLEPYESYGYPFSRTSSRQSHRSGYGEVFPAASQPNTTSFESPAYIGTAEQYEQHSYYLPSTSASSAPNLYFDPHAGNVEDTCSYQILRLRSKLENILPSLPGNTADIPFSHTGPFLNTRPPTSQQLGLDQILDVTEELIGVINQLRVETSGPQGLGLHEETLLGFHTTPSVYIFPDIDTHSFVSIMTCYIYVLKLYEPIIMSLYIKAEQQQQHQPHAAMMQYPPEIPNITLGSLTLTASADLNVGLIVNLIYQAIERIRAALNPLLPLSQNSPTNQQGDGSRGYSLQGSPPTPYTGEGFTGPGGDTTTATVESALHQINTKEQSLIGFLNMVKAMLAG